MKNHTTQNTLQQTHHLQSLEQIINHNNLIIWYLDKNLILQNYNTSFEKWLYKIYQVSPVIGKSILDIPYQPYEATISYWKAHYEQALKTKAPYSFREVFEMDIEQYVVGVDIFPVIENNEVEGLAIFAKKITEEVSADTLNKSNELQLKHLIDHSGVIFWIATKQQDILYINKAVSKIFGVEEEVVYQEKQGFWRWIHPDDATKLHEILQSNSYQERSEFREEIRIIRPSDRELRWLLVRSFSMRLGLGKRNRVLGIAEDITSLKASQEEAIKTNALLQNMLEYTQEMIFSLDMACCYTGFNQRHRHTMEQLFGGTPAKGLSIFEAVPKYAEPMEKCFLEALNGTINSAEVSYGKGMTAIYFEAVCSPIFDTKTQHVVGVSVFVKDVTSRKKAEQKAAKSVRMLRSINKNIKEAIYRTTPGDVVKYVNKAFMEMFRMPLGSQTSVPAHSFYANPKERLEIVRLLEEHGSISNKEIAFKRTNGEVFWGLLSSTRIVSENDQVYFDGAIRDITHIKEMRLALENTNEELTKANAALDSFVYSASHDLKAPLNAISGLIQLFRMDKDEERRNDYLGKIEKSVKKLEGFITDIVDYSRNSRQVFKVEKVALESTIEELLEELKFSPNAKKIEMQQSFSGNAYLHTDKVRLEAILKNLVSNAINYADHKKSPPFVHIAVKNGEEGATIRIVDNGIGIKEEYLDRIFEMFYRATEEIDGSGIGLFIVKEALDKIQGKVTVESAYGEGTIFNITLPNIG